MVGPFYFYHEIDADKMLLSTGFLLILVIASSKLISWVLPSSDDDFISINPEPIEINILPITACDSIKSNNKTTLITRFFIVILILVFIITPMNRILNTAIEVKYLF